jgi:hypothetical protein
VAASAASAITVYDPAAGLPSAQGWLPLVAGTPGTQSLAGGVFRLDTTADLGTTHGNGRLSPLLLDTGLGFTLDFTVRVASEAHTSPNRAGFSLLFVGNDPARSLELAFWAGEIFAYDYVAADPDRFVHGAGVLLDTTAAQRTYTLAVANQQFSLSTGGSTLISGALEDYTAQGLPYTTPNFLFFGDNTSRGASSVEVGAIVLSAIPEPGPGLMMLAALPLLLAWRRGRVSTLR